MSLLIGVLMYFFSLEAYESIKGHMKRNPRFLKSKSGSHHATYQPENVYKPGKGWVKQR